MEQIVIQVKDKKKAKLLEDLLRSLDFVDFVKPQAIPPSLMMPRIGKKSQDFFALAGIWKDRNVDLTSIRKKAWPRQQP